MSAFSSFNFYYVPLATPTKGTSLGPVSSWISQELEARGPSRLSREMLGMSSGNGPGQTLQTGKEVQVHVLGTSFGAEEHCCELPGSSQRSEAV